MRFRTISSSSSCSEDDTPLITMLVNGHSSDRNSYDSLCKHSKETCEFCDRTFTNRYSSIIHNMRHIIIPLINQTTYQCDECLHHFTSHNDMILHRLKKHPNLCKPQVNLVKTEFPVTMLTRQVSTVPKQENTVPEAELEDTKNVPKAETIKDRLKFEEDVGYTCNRVLNDLTTDCKVNLETFKTPLPKDPFEGCSVHYDELVKPGVFRCRRFDAIVHETSHMKLKNTKVTLCPICNKYFLGNHHTLRLHYLTHHKEYPSENLQTNTKTNSQKVNTTEKNVTKKVTFDKERESAMQVSETKNCSAVRVSSKVLMLCELCFSFCKNKSFVSYERVNALCELGKRFRCEKCGAMFFEIILVKRQIRFRQGTDPKPKAISRNEDRLKSIKNRFRMLKN